MAGGLVGVSGRLLEQATLRELHTAMLQRQMHEWDHTSLLSSLIAGALGKEISMDEINPYRVKRQYPADWSCLKMLAGRGTNYATDERGSD